MRGRPVLKKPIQLFLLLSGVGSLRILRAFLMARRCLVCVPTCSVSMHYSSDSGKLAIAIRQHMTILGFQRALSGALQNALLQQRIIERSQVWFRVLTRNPFITFSTSLLVGILNWRWNSTLSLLSGRCETCGGWPASKLQCESLRANNVLIT